jgi:hypothetical protein
MQAKVRAYWDGEGAPSVDAPLGAFFGAWAGETSVQSLMIGMDPNGWYYSYFPMPFADGATLAIRNDSSVPLTNVAFEIRYRREAYPGLGTTAGYFKATAHEEIPTTTGQDYLVQSEVGRGHVVGTVMFLKSRTDKPFGAIRSHLEGEERIHVDGSPSPAVYGTGTEEYHNGGWYFRRGMSTLPTHGVPLLFFPMEGETRLDETGAYRLYLTDPISFRSAIHFGLEHGDPYFAGTNTFNGDYRSLVFWYGLPDPGMVLSDAVDVGDSTSEADHSFEIAGSDKVVSATNFYEGDADDVGIQAAGRVGTEATSFAVTVDVANQGEMLRRRSDQGIRNQRATVFVDGVNAGTWFNPGRNTSKRWLDSDFFVPPILTAGKTLLNIRIEPEGGAVWTAYKYEVYSMFGPAEAHLKAADADTDADGLTNGVDPDDDGDGCPDVRELALDPRLGGRRDPHYFWDFLDTPDNENARDHVVSTADISRVAQRFGSSGDDTTVVDALMPPAAPPAYHAGFDRTPSTMVSQGWRSSAPDASIAIQDIGLVVAQFGHSCL